jgi:hypothetical protein
MLLSSRRAAHGGDGNRIDLANASFALSKGVSETDVHRPLPSWDLSRRALNTGNSITSPMRAETIMTFRLALSRPGQSEGNALFALGHSEESISRHH